MPRKTPPAPAGDIADVPFIPPAGSLPGECPCRVALARIAGHEWASAREDGVTTLLRQIQQDAAAAAAACPCSAA